MTELCPECGNDEQQLIAGVEAGELYEGVIAWQCLVCMDAWPAIYGRSALAKQARKIAFDLAERAAIERQGMDWTDSSGSSSS